jgi:hypothetical protein
VASKPKRRKAGLAPVNYSAPPERLIAKDSIPVRRSLGEGGNPLDGIVMEPGALAPLNCVYRDDPHGIFLYQGDCLEVLDAIAAKHPDGCFDMIFANSPERVNWLFR